MTEHPKNVRGNESNHHQFQTQQVTTTATTKITNIQLIHSTIGTTL